MPAVGRGVWQVVNSPVAYAVFWYLMYRSLAVSYWVTLPLAILAARFLVHRRPAGAARLDRKRRCDSGRRAGRFGPFRRG